MPASGQDADGVPFRQGELLRVKPNQYRPLNHIGDFLGIGMDAGGVVGDLPRRQVQKQHLQLGADGIYRQHIVEMMGAGNLRQGPLPTPLDQVRIWNFPPQKRFQREAHGVRQGFQNQKRGIADATLQLAEEGGAEARLHGKLPDRQLVLLSIGLEHTPKFIRPQGKAPFILSMENSIYKTTFVMLILPWGRAIFKRKKGRVEMRGTGNGRTLLAEGVLLLVAAIWGGGFVAGKLALAELAPAAVLAWRFLGAAAVLLALFFRRILAAGARERRTGILVGVLQFLALLVQMIGLQYTTPAKQSFICVTYVVVTPLTAWLLSGERPRRNDLLAGLLALIGMGFISLRPDMPVERGDLITLGFAALFALQLTVVGKYAAGVEAVAFSFYQFAAAGALSLAAALATNTPLTFSGGGVLAGVLYLMVINTALAMCLQNIAQKYVPSSHTAVIISLESVFGFLLSSLAFHEPITWRMLAGGGLMFGGVLLSNFKEKPGG